MYVLVAIVAAVLVGSFALAASKIPASNPALSSSSSQSSNNTGTRNLSLASLIASGSAYKGGTNAPVTLVEFGDFQCEFCDRYAAATEPQIDQQYVTAGKVAVVFKHFAWYGPDSVSAAQASQCANEQGKFWQFHDILYKNQKAINSGWAGVGNLKTFAQQIPDLNSAQFDTCLDSGKYLSQVNSDIALAKSLGFQGTPGFVVEKSDGSSPVPIAGAYPIVTFQQAIDKELVS